MGQVEERTDILRKYYKQIEVSYGFDIRGDISSEKIDYALKKFAAGADRKFVIGFYDTTITGNGKTGYLFTDTDVYYKENLEQSKKLCYGDIERIEILDMDKKDCSRSIKFYMANGAAIIWKSSQLNKTPLANFFYEILKEVRQLQQEKKRKVNIYGAAAMKSAAKLLRGNAISAGVTVVVMSSFDIANIFRGRISGKQLFKNFTNTTATVASGTGGWVAGAAAGSVVWPGIGTIVGGFMGAVAAGAVGGKVTSTVLDVFIEDDADEMVEIIQNEFTEMAENNLLNQKEVEHAVDRLGTELDEKLLMDMFSKNDRAAFARKLLEPIVSAEVSMRKKIPDPDGRQVIKAMQELLEDISDQTEK